MKQLQVNDIVFGETFREIDRREIVVRVTKTMAITDKNTRLKREVYGGYLSVPGDTSIFLSSAKYYTYTPEREAEFVRNDALNKIKQSDLQNLPTEKLLRIVNIIDEIPTATVHREHVRKDGDKAEDTNQPGKRPEKDQ